MSLLLDALKKAAEQKAQQSKSGSPLESTPDETVLEAAADDASRQTVSGDGSSRLADDETEVDHPELGARLDRSGRERGAGDDTGLELPDTTEALGGNRQPGRSAEDETGLDIPDATKTNMQKNLPAHNVSEETSLDIRDATKRNIQQDLPAHNADDETGLDIPDATKTNMQKNLPAHNASEETSLDIRDATKRNIQQDLPAHNVDDETGLDIRDATKTDIQKDSPAHDVGDETGLDILKIEGIKDSGEDDFPGDTRSGDDETIVFVAQDVANLELGSGPVIREWSKNDDETDLSQLAAEGDLTGNLEQSVDSALARDDTDLSKSLLQDSDTEDDKVAASDSDAIDLSPSLQVSAVSESENGAADGDQTDFKQPPASGDQIEVAPARLRREDDSKDAEDSAPDDDAVIDEDLSLLLVEPEATDPGVVADTSFTNPQIPADRDLVLADMAPGLEELSLVDSTQDKGAEERADIEENPTLTNPTALYADDTRTSHSAPTLTRADTTSTRTYAPDNYDRTLMRVPSDDESKIFAGMKSDSDVVMTPDYAKKVFSSKTSAQRVQHYRLYTGIAVVLVLAIGFYGIVEYQDQSEQIDSSLRSLKRDPMPGIINIAQPEKTDLFVETKALANARTVEIIQSANQAGSIPEAQEAVSQPEVVDTVPVSQPEITIAQSEPATSKPTTSESPAAPVQAEQPPATRDDTGQVVRLTSPAPSTARTDAKDNLHIASSSQYQQTDIWLQEAYAAYRIGDNQLALSLYNQVLEADPANRNALLARAAIHMQEGDIDAAIRDYQALLLANPKDSLAMSSLLAVSTYSPQETESQLKLMIREEPDSPYLNFALANSYGAQNRWQEAQRHYFMALQNNPSDPNYAYNLAVSLEHISQPSSAITYYQRALENFTKGLATFNRDVVNQRLEILGKL